MTIALNGRWMCAPRHYSSSHRFLWLRYLPFLHRGSGKMKWPRVPGTIQDTRIIPDHGLETKWGGELTWKAEYGVDYSVAARDYAVWADSGIRGESETGIRMALPQSRPPCRVRYNPRKPEESIADCR
jgi:uncharacterized protein DUF3592